MYKKTPLNGVNLIEGKVASSIFAGDYRDCHVKLGEKTTRVFAPVHSNIKAGEIAYIEFDPSIL